MMQFVVKIVTKRYKSAVFLCIHTIRRFCAVCSAQHKAPEAFASGASIFPKTSQPFANGAAKESLIIFSGDMCG